MSEIENNVRTFVEGIGIESDGSNTQPKMVTQAEEAARKEASEDASLKEAYEKWITLNEELDKVEAQIQQAHASEYEKVKKEYTTAQQKVRARYTKWLTHTNEYEKMKKKYKGTQQKAQAGYVKRQTPTRTTTNKVISINVERDNNDVKPIINSVNGVVSSHVLRLPNSFTKDS